MHSYHFVAIAALILKASLTAAPAPPFASQQPLPRSADGKPKLDGIWQASGTAEADLQDHAAGYNMVAGRSVVAGGAIPYQPWAVAKKAENLRNRLMADPLAQCYMPGVPRIMYMDFPFQIFQTPQAIAITFEWSLVYRLIYTDGSPHSDNIDSWMGDSRGRLEGDTLVVDVTNHNDQTWFDRAGDFHSNALHIVERYRMTNPDTIKYDVTLDDPNVFTKPWTINLEFHRRTDLDRLFEYVCQAEAEEVSGAFTREERTWYSGNETRPPQHAQAHIGRAPAVSLKATGIRRTADGKPDLQGFYEPGAGGANQGLERRAAANPMPPGRGVIVDPPDGKLPMLPWAVKETADRNLPERGYDDPTAHCFPAGVPRSMYVPAALHIIQTPEYVVFLHERMSWRIVPLSGQPHLPDSIRLWQGDSVGHWEGDTLVVDTANFNGKTWLNEGGEIVSYAEHVTERFTPAGPDSVNYEATVTDPVVYERPWTIAFPFKREKFELIESPCHETDHDLPHLKALKDAAAKKK